MQCDAACARFAAGIRTRKRRPTRSWLDSPGERSKSCFRPPTVALLALEMATSFDHHVPLPRSAHTFVSASTARAGGALAAAGGAKAMQNGLVEAAPVS